MNFELEKRAIIEEITHVQDEWLLKAIKRLLGLDYEEDIPSEHKRILDERITSLESGKSKLIELEDAKKRLKSKK